MKSTIPLFSSIWVWWSDILDTHKEQELFLCVDINTVYFRILTYFIIAVGVLICLGISARYAFFLLLLLLFFNCCRNMDLESVNTPDPYWNSN